MRKEESGQISLKLYNVVAYSLYIQGKQNLLFLYNMKMKIIIPQQIQEWAFKLSDGILGEEKLPLCPWAKKAVLDGSVDCWVDENPLNLIPLPEEIKVRIVHLPGKSLTDLIEIRDLCNSGEEEFIFLESHPEDLELIGGIKSVSDLPLIIIQRRKELLEARKMLSKGNYYQYWDPEVLSKMLNI